MKYTRKNNTKVKKKRARQRRKKTKCASVMSTGGWFAETMKQFINVGIENRKQKARALKEI